MKMHKAKVQLKNETGLHARPASMFVKEASKYSSDVMLVKDEKEFNGKSIMGILSMGVQKGDTITIQAQGEDEREAVESLKLLIDGNFGE